MRFMTVSECVDEVVNSGDSDFFVEGDYIDEVLDNMIGLRTAYNAFSELSIDGCINLLTSS